ncbi:MAG: hypothetical protein ACLUSP_06100 [Christensenellales bacterium]
MPKTSLTTSSRRIFQPRMEQRRTSGTARTLIVAAVIRDRRRKQGNGALKLTSDIEYGYVYTRLKSFAPVSVRSAGKFTARVAVDRDTDLVEFYGGSGSLVGSKYMLKANEWTDVDISTIKFD